MALRVMTSLRFYSIACIFLIGSSGLTNIAYAQTTCAPASNGLNITISSNCADLVLVSAGNVEISSSATITSASQPASIKNQVGTTNLISNYGSILSANTGSKSTEAFGIINYGSITTLNNSGTILNVNTNTGSDSNAAFGIINYGTITTLSNSGTISNANIAIGTGSNAAFGIINNGIITTLNNSGIILSANTGIGSGATFGIINDVTITTLNNSGTIASDNKNTGAGGNAAFGIINNGTITTLNNSGSIWARGEAIDAIGISNVGVITTLNNAQGGNRSSAEAKALTYDGKVPTNYNIAIINAFHYGQLVVSDPSGTLSIFGIYGSPLITSRIYAGVLTNNVIASNVQKMYDNMSLALVDNALTGAYDLTFTGVSLMGAQQSLVNTANALAHVDALQNAILVNSFTYDCTLFDVNNICISLGGRNTAVSAANGLNNTSALLIVAYRPHPNYRIGAYVDQNLSVNNAGSTVNLSNNTPLIGIFGAWAQNHEGTGAEVRVSAAYGQKDTTITRQVVGLSESGSGSSTLNSQGAQIAAKYGFGIMDKVLVSPYVGMRYTQNNMAGYTEGSSATVTAPLTYSALNTNATTAIAGVGASYQVIPTVITFASAGVETDTNTSNGTYSATGINGLTPVNFNPNPVRTRPTATLGAYYDIVKNQRLGITGIYRQEVYQAVSSTTVMATYTIGL